MIRRGYPARTKCMKKNERGIGKKTKPTQGASVNTPRYCSEMFYLFSQDIGSQANGISTLRSVGNTCEYAQASPIAGIQETAFSSFAVLNQPKRKPNRPPSSPTSDNRVSRTTFFGSMVFGKGSRAKMSEFMVTMYCMFFP